MSEPGWYPDPGGRPGHYRFWDGQAWAPTTSTSLPGAAAPPSAPGPGTTPRTGRSRRPLVLAVVAAVLVLAVVGALVVRGGNSPIVDAGPSPSATGPGGDTTPAPTPSTTPSDTPSPAGSPSPTPFEVPSADPCPVGDPFTRQEHPRDGRVHGGGLSVPRQPGWQDPGVQASAFTWAYDLGETDTQLAQTRFAAYAVGAVSVADGFEDPRSAAALILGCTVTSALYSDVSGTTELVDEETTVDGYRAWSLRAEVRTYDARTSFSGDTVQVIVVDLGSPESLAFFWGSAPTGDEAFQARLDQAVEQLRVE